MAMQFKKATKQQARLRLALIGPSGSGKTYSALNIGKHLGERIALIDTERGSASKYAGLFEFDTLELDTFSPQTYVEAIHAAESAGYDVLVIDSLSHAWMGKEGALEQVDRAAKRSQSNNSYTAWRDVTPMHNALIDAMLQSRCHIIATMRAKTEYVLEENERGKKVPRKVGMAPVQRDGMEYEFDVVADMNQENDLIVSKSRCPALSGQVISKPGKQVADALKGWLTDGAPRPTPEPTNGNGTTKPAQTTTPPANGKQHEPEHKPAPFANIITMPPDEEPSTNGNGSIAPATYDPTSFTYPAGRQYAKLGDYKWPSAWFPAVKKDYPKTVPQEVEAILLKLEITPAYNNDAAIGAVSAYLSAKASGADDTGKLQAARDYITAVMDGVSEQG